MSTRPERQQIVARDPQLTSRIMSAVRSTNSSVERLIRRELWSRGLRYRIHARRTANGRLPGRPDLLFIGPRVVVFVDSDFFHGRVLVENGPEALERQFREEKRQYWVEKIQKNVRRDISNNAWYREHGWHVIRLWESAIRGDPIGCADQIASVVRRRRARPAA